MFLIGIQSFYSFGSSGGYKHNKLLLSTVFLLCCLVEHPRELCFILLEVFMVVLKLISLGFILQVACSLSTLMPLRLLELSKKLGRGRNSHIAFHCLEFIWSCHTGVSFHSVYEAPLKKKKLEDTNFMVFIVWIFLRLQFLISTARLSVFYSLNIYILANQIVECDVC